MNRHAGASFTLSVLIVAFFAVVLYQPDPHRASSSGGRSPSRSSAPDPVAANAGPAPTPGVPLIEATAERVPLPVEESRTPSAIASGPRPLSSRPPAGRDPAGAATVSRPTGVRRFDPGLPPRSKEADPPAPFQTVSRRRPVTPAPRSAFTQVGEGESLADVAARVYGTREAAHDLWMANRDVIDNPETPLRNGSLLRTP